MSNNLFRDGHSTATRESKHSQDTNNWSSLGIIATKELSLKRFQDLIAHLLCSLFAAQITSAETISSCFRIIQDLTDRIFNGDSFGLHVQRVTQQHSSGKDGSYWVGN